MDTRSNFLSLLNLIETERAGYMEGLGEGQSRQEIESLIEIHPIPAELIAIYSCVSGYADMECSPDLIPAYSLISLDCINIHIDIFREVSSSLIENIGELAYGDLLYWEPDMIPFFADGGGYRICVRTLPNDNSIWAIPKVGDSYKLNTNLDRFILTAIECYRQGAYYQELDEDVLSWDTDEALAREIVKVIDPDIEDYSPP
jgi:hypothetical protein